MSAEITVKVCPFCQSWQVDYTYAVSAEFIMLNVVRDPGEHEPRIEVDTQPWYDVLDGVVSEHLMTCNPLALATALARQNEQRRAADRG